MSIGVCTCLATTDGLTKMPAPIMPPITIMVASNAPRRRAKEGSVEFNSLVQRNPASYARTLSETYPLRQIVDLDDAHTRAAILPGDNRRVGSRNQTSEHGGLERICR